MLASGVPVLGLLGHRRSDVPGARRRCGVLVALMTPSERQPDGEGRAIVRAGHTDPAVVVTNQLVDQRQADARSFLRASAGLLHPVKPLEDVRQVLDGDPDAGVAHHQLGVLRQRPQADVDRPFPGVLERVGQQVRDDLLPHLPVHPHGLEQGRGVDGELEPGGLGGTAEYGHDLGGQRREVRRQEPGVQPPGLQLGEVEQGPDQAQQPAGVAFGQLQVGRQVRREFPGPLQRLLQRRQQQRQRGAELVADVGEELRLDPVQLGQPLQPLPLPRGGVRLGYPRPDRVARQRQELAVAVVQRRPRGGAEDEHADERAVGVVAQRVHEGALGCHGLGTDPVAAEPGGEVLHEHRAVGPHHLVERPGGAGDTPQLPRRQRLALDDSGRGHQAGDLPGEQVGGGERHVVGIGEHRERIDKGLPPAVSPRRASERVEHRQPPRRQHLQGALEVGAVHAHGGAVGLVDRRVGHVEPSVLQATVAR